MSKFEVYKEKCEVEKVVRLKLEMRSEVPFSHNKYPVLITVDEEGEELPGNNHILYIKNGELHLCRNISSLLGLRLDAEGRVKIHE